VGLLVIDTRVVGGMVVDGTGRPGVRADVAVRDGRIVADDGSPADRTLDATGLVVAPGFVDVHTHYDAQVLWDPMVTPSPLHGVTTVISGNCGFSLAPADKDDFDYLVRTLSRVEGMPLPALRSGVVQRWHSTGELLDLLDYQGVGPNIGVLAGHTAIRRAVMKDRAVGEAATGGEVAAMRATLDRCLREGALGFSTSRAPTHSDADLRAVPSRWADRDECVALAGVVADHPGTCLEIVPEAAGAFDEAEVDLMTALSLAADRPINWNVLIVGRYDPVLYANRLAASDQAAAAGACVKGLVRPDPSVLTMSFATGMMLEALSEDWRQLFTLDGPARCAALGDPEVRRRLDIDGGAMGKLTRWADYTVGQTFAEANAGLTGRRVGEVAAERGVAAFDAVLDIVVADDLRTGLEAPVDDGGPDSWGARRDLCADPRMVVGGSDAGGHVDIMCGAQYSTKMIADFLSRHLMPLEQIVHQLTDVPARFMGLVGRGRIAEGFAADLVVLDPGAVGAHGLELRSDLPGGATRLYGGADGIEHVLVNGVPIVEHGALTEARPGTVLRSGRDTRTLDNATALAGDWR
jgi:N-acyl-D-aspartate/D-glutamate deacylase